MSVLARNPHKGLACKIFMRPEEDKERKGSRVVNQSRKKVTVRERRLPSEELGPVDSEASWLALEDESEFLVDVREFSSTHS